MKKKVELAKLMNKLQKLKKQLTIHKYFKIIKLSINNQINNQIFQTKEFSNYSNLFPNKKEIGNKLKL